MLLVLAGLGGTAAAEEEPTPRPEPKPSPAMKSAVDGEISIGSSRRGVAQDYLVLPKGAEVTGAMRIITAEPVFGPEPLRFTDLALFTLSGRYALFRKLEISAGASFLAKQPSDTDEKPWQSVAFGMRSALGPASALAITGAGGHLIGQPGKWTQEAITLSWRKPIEDILAFDVSAGMDAIGISSPRTTSTFITEVAVGGSGCSASRTVTGARGSGSATPSRSA
jgi:hypothetical protein